MAEARSIAVKPKRVWKAQGARYRSVKNVREHRAVAERVLGKSLPVGAQVHHVDGDTANNVPSNLVICQDRAYHALLHLRANVVALGGDPNTERVCHKCNMAVPMDQFYRRRNGLVVAICKTCNLRRQAQGRRKGSK